MKQLLQWLGGESFDGIIVFDECHKAKNLVPCGSAKPTKTGLAVLELQEKLPNARIVYASATGASEPKNMAYMVRLGLWGNGTPFVDFNDFIQSIEKRGVGAMEIVAMDMKLRGMYMARQLSFSGVTFKVEEIPLNKEYVRMYDEAVQLVITILYSNNFRIFPFNIIKMKPKMTPLILVLRVINALYIRHFLKGPNLVNHFLFWFYFCVVLGRENFQRKYNL